MAEPTSELASLLGNLDAGDTNALDAIFAMVYEELRRVAHARRAEWRGAPTLNTTALLHEAYLKLADSPRLRPESRAHFLSIASRAMRQILLNYARERSTRKRGGGRERVTLDAARAAAAEGAPFTDREADALVALDEALTRLQRTDQRRGAVVEYRFFGGMTVEETAQALGVSARTVKRDWVLAQAWLRRELDRAS